MVGNNDDIPADESSTGPQPSDGLPPDTSDLDDTNDISGLQKQRANRLAKIKAAIDAGEYDSEELLNTALERMIDQVIPDDAEDHS